MKSNQNPTTPINQGTTHKPNIDDVCLPLCKIRGIAELFSTMLPGEMRELGCDASAGIYEILNNAADEIQTMINNTIADLTAENESKAKARERQARKLYDIRCGEVAR